MIDLYLRPTAFIESPQRHDGAAVRLAGTMLWFSQIEVIDRTGAGIERHLVDMRQWDEFLSGISTEKQARCGQLYTRLTTPRAASRV